MNINDIIQRRRAVYPNQYENAEIEDSFIKLLLKIVVSFLKLNWDIQKQQ